MLIPDFQDICVELNLAPATELLFQRCSDRLKDLLQKQPSAALVRDSIGKTPLHWAVALKNHEAIDMLIEAGADVHAVGHDGRTPLYDAICVLGRSRTTCIKMIQAGSDVNHTTPDGSSPLRNAIDVNSLVPVVDILIDAGADVHHVHNGENLLHITAKACTAFTCEELLWAGVDIDARTRFGHTAAMIAAQNNNHDVLKTLIYHRAQLNNTTLEGHTVVHSAASCGDIETMKILEQACIKGLPMDEEALEQYWLWFDERVHYIIPTRRASLEAEEAAFQALLDSITPARSVMLEHHEDHKAFHIPGAFPINPDEPNCDSRVAEVQEQDDDDGYEEGRDGDNESWITTDDDSSSCEAGMEAASDDELDELN
ncbi:hypothetical protein J4E81_009780 [Alternaria sp. BMP 2799]|nr:hypothetical protein J4E81_009780 [Alternaria sp. BMP 2799]